MSERFKINETIDVLILKFENGIERYNTDPLLYQVINQLARGCDPYFMIDQLISTHQKMFPETNNYIKQFFIPSGNMKTLGPEDVILVKEKHFSEFGLNKAIVMVKNSFTINRGELVFFDGRPMRIDLIHKNYKEPVYHKDDNGEENKEVIVRGRKYETTLTLIVCDL